MDFHPGQISTARCELIERVAATLRRAFMSEIKRILMPTDFSHNANQALHYAIMLADTFGAEVTAFHVVTLFESDPNNPSHQFPEMSEVYDSMEKAANINMKQLLADHAEVKIKYEVVRGISPAEDILNHAKTENFDLIVLGTHGRSGISRFLLGSATEKIIRHMPCPVMTIRYHSEMLIKPQLKRIVVPLDFSAYSKQALAYATAYASKFGASLYILHVIEEQLHPAYYVTGDVSIFKLIPDLREKSHTALQQFAGKEIPKNIEHSFHIREGRAHNEIVNFGEEQDADLIVITTHGLSGLDHLLIGSTTEKVVRKAKCPVLAVKAKTR